MKFTPSPSIPRGSFWVLGSVRIVRLSHDPDNPRQQQPHLFRVEPQPARLQMDLQAGPQSHAALPCIKL